MAVVILTVVGDDSAPFIARLDCDRNTYGRSGRALPFSWRAVSEDVDGGGIVEVEVGLVCNRSNQDAEKIRYC